MRQESYTVMLAHCGFMFISVKEYICTKHRKRILLKTEASVNCIYFRNYFSRKQLCTQYILQVLGKFAFCLTLYICIPPFKTLLINMIRDKCLMPLFRGRKGVLSCTSTFHLQAVLILLFSYFNCEVIMCMQM